MCEFTQDISITWDLVRNVSSQAHTKCSEFRNFGPSISFMADSDESQSLRTTDLEHKEVAGIPLYMDC